jgi:hypothetical protein
LLSPAQEPAQDSQGHLRVHSTSWGHMGTLQITIGISHHKAPAEVRHGFTVEPLARLLAGDGSSPGTRQKTAQCRVPVHQCIAKEGAVLMAI